MENIDLSSEAESKASAEGGDSLFYINKLDQSVERLRLLRQVAVDKGFTRLPDNAASWYREELRDAAAVNAGYQYSDGGEWRLIIPEDARKDSSLTEEAKYWHDFQEANYDVVTKAGLALSAGVCGKDRATCESCFASVTLAIDSLEPDLCEDWQSFVPFELLDATMNYAEKPNPEAFDGFKRVVSSAVTKFPKFFEQKTASIILKGEDKSKPSLVERKTRLVTKEDDVASLMLNKGKADLSAILRDVSGEIPQRNHVAVTIEKEDGVISAAQIVSKNSIDVKNDGKADEVENKTLPPKYSCH